MIITAGKVQLRSGNWSWELLGGQRVRWLHFVMDGEPDNQMMRPLVSDSPVDDATAKRFASHPGTRVWLSPDGQRWLIHDLSYLARFRREGPRELMMIDEEGEPHRVEVSESLELGQLNDAEVADLLKKARRATEANDGGTDTSTSAPS
jgi:hypothetical protein